MSLKFDNQPKILSDIYSEITESSTQHVEIFENQAYSTQTKTVPGKEKSKKDQCERNLVYIVISVITLLLLAVVQLLWPHLSKFQKQILFPSAPWNPRETRTPLNRTVGGPSTPDGTRARVHKWKALS